MSRKRSSYCLFKMKGKKGIVYYWWTYDENGNQTSNWSTGKSTKREAEAYLKDLYDKIGSYIKPTKKRTTALRFKQFAKNFFIWDKSDYVKRKKARGGEDALTKNYIDTMDSLSRNHILPTLGNMFLKKITAQDIEELLVSRKEQGLSSSSINIIYQGINLIFKEAYRLEYIDSNPMDRVEKFSVRNTKKKELLTKAELQKLFDKVSNPFGNDKLLILNLLSCCTGMRVGECLSLRGKDISKSNDYISLKHSYHDRYGLGKTKTKKERVIPLSKELMRHLRKLKIECQDEEYLFSYDGLKPFSQQHVRDALYRALKRVGISKCFTFHSWRNQFITTSRQIGIPDTLIREYVGHSSIEMTEHYTADSLFTEKNIIPFKNMQEEIAQ